MKSSTSKTFEDFPSFTLYLDDLKEILDVLQESCEEVKLQTLGFTDVSPLELDELAQNIESERFPNIYINAINPNVTIDIRSFGLRVFIFDDEVVQRGIVSKIRDVVNKRQRKYFGKVIYFFYGICGLVLASLIYQKYFLYAVVLLGPIFIAINPSVKYIVNNKVKVFTENKSHRPSFIERKKDDLVISLVSASIGALLGVVLTKYLA